MAKELLLFFSWKKIIYNRFWWKYDFCLMGWLLRDEKKNRIGHQTQIRNRTKSRFSGWWKNAQVMMITFTNQISFFLVRFESNVVNIFSSKKHSIFRWLSIDQIIKIWRKSYWSIIFQLFFSRFHTFTFQYWTKKNRHNNNGIINWIEWLLLLNPIHLQ